jgi:FlaA1/EpsC-like NDP-sugar epimerase
MGMLNEKTERLRAVGADDSGAIGGRSLLLIGTGRALGALAAQLASLERPPTSVGCVLAWEGGGGEETRESLPPGLPLLGGIGDLWRILAQRKPDMALICLPAHMTDALEQATRTLASRRVPARFVPTLADMLRTLETQRGCEGASHGPALGRDIGDKQSENSAATWRPSTRVDLARLIGRTPRKIDAARVAEVITGKRVLITGAGGSIGSELARVSAALEPEQLILMDRSENALFEIDRQLGERFGAVARRAILHDVTDERATRRLLATARPQIVFHAAAHKHVPLMEDHPAHAITNNVFGSKSIADAAVEAGAERFVMISSDKAVNPTSVMGATKRLAEVYVRSLARRGCATRPSMVRFGNVLGSACSVLTIWSAQIAEGGPLTITDPRMTRYFMTIPEAATLVVQSAALDVTPRAAEERRGGAAPVFVLDMGEPVRIVDLATRFVRAHGLRARFVVTGEAEEREPGLSALLSAMRSGLEDSGDAAGGVDEDSEPIDIVFTGARPGEKLHEQLAYEAEDLRPTTHPGIMAWSGSDAADELDVDGMLADLDEARRGDDRSGVLEALRRYVPELRRVEPVTAARRERLIA